MHSAMNKALAVLTVVVVLASSLMLVFTPVSASPSFARPLCGEGSAPDYGFTYNLRQPHWMVNWENYTSETTATVVDTFLDQLDADAITQMMILLLPDTQVGNRVNCAVHFLRYMKLGNPSGAGKDNGFVFLVVVEADKIDVHYGVGLGLPALTAPELTNLNRAAEEIYQSTQSLDEAVLTLVQGYDAYARSKYPVSVLPSPTPIPIILPELPQGPLGTLTMCCLACVGIFAVLFVLWLLTKIGSMGGTFTSSGSRSFGGSHFPRGGGGGSSPRTRGGGGSGRSGRGN